MKASDNIAIRIGNSLMFRVPVRKCDDRNNFMSAEEAKADGLVDYVVESRKQIPNLAEKCSVVQ